MRSLKKTDDVKYSEFSHLQFSTPYRIKHIKTTPEVTILDSFIILYKSLKANFNSLH